MRARGDVVVRRLRETPGAAGALLLEAVALVDLHGVGVNPAVLGLGVLVRRQRAGGAALAAGRRPLTLGVVPVVTDHQRLLADVLDHQVGVEDAGGGHGSGRR